MAGWFSQKEKSVQSRPIAIFGQLLMENSTHNAGEENGRTGGGGDTTTVDQGAVRDAVQEILMGIPGMSSLMDTGVASLVAAQATGPGAGEY